MCYWEESICKQIEISYAIMVLLSIPINKLPWVEESSDSSSDLSKLLSRSGLISSMSSSLFSTVFSSINSSILQVNFYESDILSVLKV